MIPCQYSECVSLATVPAHHDRSCASFCDIESVNRCKTGVSFGPGLAPTFYRDAIIVYLNSTRRRYISRVEYTTKLKPKSYSDTNYMRPKHVSRSFVAFYEHHGDETRRWYKSSVQLKPKTFTSSEVPIPSSQNVSEESGIELEDGDESTDGVLSPLRSPGRGKGQQQPWATTRDNRLAYNNKGSMDSNANQIISQRSGPFIYNAPKERYRRYNDLYEGPYSSRTRPPATHHSMTNGYGHETDDSVDL